MKPIYLFLIALFIFSSCEKTKSNNSELIIFEDNVVFAALLNHPGVDTNNDDNISYEEAANVKTLRNCFENYHDMIISFNELQHFTNLQTTEDLFKDCIDLQYVTLPPISRIDDNTFLGCSTIKSIVIPESVTSIGKDAFKNCLNLTNINIPDSVISFDGSPFDGCDNLPVIDNIKYADTYLVSAIKELNTINIKEGTIWIGDHAFTNSCNYRLKSITIPSSVKYIGVGSFFDETIGGTKWSGNVVMKPLVPPKCSYVLPFGYNFNLFLHVPKESVDLYLNDPIFSSYLIAGSEF